MNTPVLLMVFKKPNTTKKIFKALSEIGIKNLYISVNIPLKKNKQETIYNKEVKKIITKVNWDCNIKYKMRRKYVDAYTSYKEAIEWFFKMEKEGIILEDDTLPNKTFFYFFKKLLKKYRHNKKIPQICGSSFINQKKISGTNYFFSNHSLCWGYATWRRSIADYDEKMSKWPTIKKNNSFLNIINDKKFLSYWHDIFELQYKKKFKAWDYTWLYSNWAKNKLSIIPKKHLIQNIGFVKGATHTKIKYKDWYNDLKTEEMKINDIHPTILKPKTDYDKWLSKNVFRVEKFYLKKKMNKIKLFKKIKPFYQILKLMFRNLYT